MRSTVRRFRAPRAAAALAVATMIALALSVRGGTAARAISSSTLDRPADPVVMTGVEVPGLAGIAPSLLVAFRYDGGWQQIPVQVDERKWIDLVSIYNVPQSQVPYLGGKQPMTELAYADAGTFAGADPNPALDSDDEIVFMAADAGGDPPAVSEPAGVLAGTGQRVLVTDPLAPAEQGSVYLFASDGSLDPSAGQQYVTYTFDLLSGPYLTTYDTVSGPNPEDTIVTSPFYTHHFSDRWISDAFTISAGGASGVDILDRHKSMFGPGVCGRSEDTFSAAEGAFIVNKSGPVRALRSYVGANSGPFTQRDHAFYARREDITTALRVHEIPSVMDFFDYSPAASGMVYRNDLNTTGVTIDGANDTVATGAITWESVTGPQGSMTMAGGVTTNQSPFSYTSYYLDDTTPPVAQCTGDAFAYGSSGVWVNATIPCTDPGNVCAGNLTSQRHIYFDAPGLDATGAAEHAANAGAPLRVDVTQWGTGSQDHDGDTIGDITDTCVWVADPGQQNNDRNFIDMSPPKPYDDITLARSDHLGDACDDDDDNDGIPDINESAGAPCPFTTAATNPMRADSDGDRTLDGAECFLAANPNNGGTKPTAASCGYSTDADADGLLAYRELCYFGTDSGIPNSDGDELDDGCEVASVNADAAVNVLDLQQVAQSVPPTGTAGYILNIDMNRDGTINVLDLQFVAQRMAPCP